MRAPIMAILPLLIVGCGGDPAERAVADAELRQTAAQDTIRMASEAYDVAGFDSIRWAADSVAVSRGAIVWSFSCAKCHGPSGLGDAGFVLNGDTLRPPSLLEPEWQFAADHDGLRRYIFAGNVQGMPHWGLVGLKARDIDAVARYITGSLRAPPRAARR